MARRQTDGDVRREGDRVKQKTDYPVSTYIFGTLVWLTLSVCSGVLGWWAWGAGTSGVFAGISLLLIAAPMALACAVRDAWRAWNKRQRTRRQHPHGASR